MGVGLEFVGADLKADIRLSCTHAQCNSFEATL